MRWHGSAALAALACFVAPAAWAQAGPPMVLPRVVVVQPAPVVVAPPMIMVAPTAPPAPQSEVIPPPPEGREKLIVWQPGHWAWVNEVWMWEPGQNVSRPSETSTWVPGQWQLQPSGSYMWVGGRWG